MSAPTRDRAALVVTAVLALVWIGVVALFLCLIVSAVLG